MTTDQAEVAALRIILSNVVARLAVLEAAEAEQRREMLGRMSDTCKLAAERYPLAASGPEQAAVVRDMLKHIDEFFKGITIT